MYATDLEAAERFYADVLRLEPFARVTGRHVFFRCGAGVFLVFNPEATSVPTSGGRPVPLHGARGAGHAAFAVLTAELPPWRERLTRHGVSIEAEVDWPGGGKSLYVRDPAGNSIELATAAVWGLEESRDEGRGTGDERR